MLPLDIEETRYGFRAVDHDTGMNLICFLRRGRVYCYLQNPTTGRFIKMLRTFYLQYVGIYEMCYPSGCRKGKGCSPKNNLHVECHSYNEIVVSNYTSVRELINDLERTADDLQFDCMDCFEKFNILPEHEHIWFRSVEGNAECYFDRCERLLE